MTSKLNYFFLKKVSRYLVFSLFFVSLFLLSSEKASAITFNNYTISPSSFEAGSRSTVRVVGFLEGSSSREICQEQGNRIAGKYPNEPYSARYNPSWRGRTGLNYPEFRQKREGEAKETCVGGNYVSWQYWTRFDVDVSSLSPGNYSIQVEAREDRLIGGITDWVGFPRGEVNFTVTAPPSPRPTVSLDANPTSVSYGNSSTLTWTPVNATSCNASGAWGGSRNKNGGSKPTGALFSNSTYTIICSGPGGTSLPATVTVSVGAAPTVSVNLSANPTSVSYGNSSTLSWSSSNATSCSASGNWSGSKGTSGSQSTGGLTSNKSYTLTCTGSGGTSLPATVTVSVGSPPEPDKPDLYLYGSSVASNPVYVGDTVNFDFIIKNIGDARVGLEPSIHCYLNGSEFDIGHSDNLWPGEVDWTWCQETNIGPAGNYTFEACVDELGQVDEENENNNCDSVSFTIQNQAIDNASQSSVSIPSSFKPGETKTISFTVNNTGSTWWSHGSAYQFRRTDDSAFVLNCSGLNYSHLPHSVHAGHSSTSYSASCSLTAPSTPATYTFSMQMRHTGGWGRLAEPGHGGVDGGGSTYFFGTEMSQSITVEEDPIPSCSSAGPDGATVTYGDTHTVYAYDVTNTTSVYFPTWSTAGGQDDLVWYPGTDGGGGTWSASIPSTAHDIGAMNTHVYMNGGSYSNQWCDTADFTIVSAPEADLTTSSGPTPDIVDITEGDNVKFTAGITNSGNLAIPSGTNFNVRFTVNGSTFSNKTVNSLGAGSTVSRTSSSWNAILGSHTIQACADLPTSIVSESNESNNCRSTVVNVSVYVPPQCNDGIDNDGDTWIDAEDPGCWTDSEDSGTYDPSRTSEVNLGKQCSDGLDNDGDGFIDGDDPECTGPTDSTEADIKFEEF